MTRKTIGSFGPKGRTVRVFVDGDLVRCQWREAGKLKTKSWANTPSARQDAKAWAKGFSEARELRPTTARRLTLRALWEAYKLAEFCHLRERTQVIYRDGWQKWEQAWGADFPADDVTQTMLNEFRDGMEKSGLAVNTTRMAIRVVKTVMAFGERTDDMLTRNRLASWRFKLAKEKRPKPPAEFTGEEFGKIMAALDPNRAGHWRAYVVLAICGAQGARQHAVLHLQWEDVDLVRGEIRWRPEWDKMGNDWRQPLRDGTRRALEVAARHRTTSPWIVPAPRGDDEPYTAQSLWWMLRETSRRAGVAILKGRGAHGLRKMVAGDVAALTGNVVLALQSIGDTSLQMADRYILTRQTDVANAFSALDKNKAEEPET